jgi:hypothetical protein
MCVVKKYNIDLKRSFVSNHCVATLKNVGLVDMCLFSGEGKPTLLGGYVLSKKEAFDLGKGLMNTSAMIDTASEEEKKKIINENIVMAYQLLQGINKDQAEQLRKLFDIKIIEQKPPTEDHGYIG